MKFTGNKPEFLQHLMQLSNDIYFPPDKMQEHGGIKFQFATFSWEIICFETLMLDLVVDPESLLDLLHTKKVYSNFLPVLEAMKDLSLDDISFFARALATERQCKTNG